MIFTNFNLRLFLTLNSIIDAKNLKASNSLLKIFSILGLNILIATSISFFSLLIILAK